jgi:hypothetical protein
MNRIKKYLILAGSILLGMLGVTSAVKADQQIQDDLVVVGSICIGLDCVNNESFGFDTIRLKENNLRIKFQDTSSSSSFPTNDWQITVNDSLNGGANWFGIEDIDAGTTPFTILAKAPNESLYVSASGNIGLGTTTPIVDLVIKGRDTPTLRLEQDGTAGFTEQIWDVGGNESNFFIRDVTNGGILPFRIAPNAPKGSIYVAADGDIGFETTTPDGQFDVAHSANGNDHAFLISPVSYVGINIDNGFEPRTLFEIQHTGGQSRFAVKSSGEVGIGTFNPSGRFDVRDMGDTLSYFNVDASGDVGIGTNSPVGRFEVTSSDAATSHFVIDASGNIGFNTPVPTSLMHLSGTAAFPAALLTIENTDAAAVNAVGFLLKNAGSNFITFEDSSAGAITPLWNLSSRIQGDFRITNAIGTGEEFNLSQGGNLTISGDLTANSTLYTSSRSLKENFALIDGEKILNGILGLPISQWNYKSNDASIVHIGPMAEDFHQTFSLNGDSTEQISVSDIAGVTLAAIQQLKKLIDEKDQKIEYLIEEIEKIKSQSR